jgi:two-component system sensor histidine kinase DctS
MNLPGTDLFLGVTPVGVQPATVPRIFFLVALLFLAGMLVSLWALRRDFVKRQQVQALFQAQVALRTAMENSVTIGLRAWDRSGKILYVNDSFCSLVGYPPSELVGQSTPLPYWPSDQADELNLVHRDIIAQGTHEDGVEVQFQHRDGHLLDVLIHEAPLNTATGQQIGWMSSVLDISERKRAERMAARQQERLQASGRLVVVGEVASTLAHELNQPLGALSSFANGLLNRLRGERISLAEVMPVVERIERLADKAGRIIQRVNAFARRREMSRQRLDLVAFLRATLSQHQMQRQVSLDVALGQAPVWVEADALLLEHAVLNVVANALHWAPLAGTPGRVQVSMAQDEGLAAIVVGDTGPGVSEEHKEQIFSAFFSASAEGMGMGLAICRSVLEAHHGRIDVGRDSVLGGAQFTLWLPLSGDGAGTAPAAGQ